jgi:SAM-dependent methyltransferase
VFPEANASTNHTFLFRIIEMFSESADVYDLLYGQLKNYSEEAQKISRLVQRLRPSAKSILDVGCGTGEHAWILADEHGFDVDGLDLQPELVRSARAKHPNGRFFCEDMTDFRLGARYDVVLCLFSSIGYVRTLENLRRTLGHFHQHLVRGGLVVVEPWFEADAWKAGTVHLLTAESDGVTVSRMSHSGVRGDLSVIDFHYLIGRADGVEHRKETHELGLFTRQDLADSLSAAGFVDVAYDPEGLMGRGMFTASAAG